jgi:hypothetical protein
MAAVVDPEAQVCEVRQTGVVPDRWTLCLARRDRFPADWRKLCGCEHADCAAAFRCDRARSRVPAGVEVVGV